MVFQYFKHARSELLTDTSFLVRGEHLKKRNIRREGVV